jgi:hypothetical protein
MGGQKDVPEAVYIEIVKVVLGEIEFESASEVPNASFKLLPVEGRD